MKQFDELLNFSIINLDKSSGPTSYSISEYVRRQLGLTKTSHMGTLDPKVTGVLPITLGRACRLAQYFIKHDKSYVGILHTHKPQTIEKLQALLSKHFVGTITQTPPHRSAVKRAERKRIVYYFTLTEVDAENRDFLFKCKVEGGTYIRKICSDLGEMIGGAHMEELRRTQAGIFDETTLVSLQEFDEAVDLFHKGDDTRLRAMLVSAEHAIQKVLPTAQVDKQALKSLLNGKPLFKRDMRGETPRITPGKDFALFCGELFVGVYTKSKEEAVFGRGVFIKN